MNKIERILSLDREDKPALEITRADDGFLICLLMSARRIKNVKKPQ